MIDQIFSGINGHKKILEILTQTVTQPAAAYLFSGPNHVGKRLVADRFSRLLLNLSLTDSLEAHPDFVRVRREEGAKEIVVKQARELVARMHLTSARGGKKIALIEQADRLNEEACNALLKAVEEPSPNEVYIFIAEQPERLPATLRSRLTIIPFHLVPGTKNPVPGTSSLMETLVSSPMGVQCQALEKRSQQLEATDDASDAWREELQGLMADCRSLFSSDPRCALRVGHGLIHAWYLTSTNLSPRLALEWAAASSYLISESIPSFLLPRYL